MESYDPYANRAITSKSTSNFEVIIHLIKSSFGIGVLSLPFAIAKAGYLMAAIIGVPLVFITLYGIHILIRTMVKISASQQKPYIAYEECLEIVVRDGPSHLQRTASFAKYTVETFLLAYPLGICAGYVIFMSHSLAMIYSFTEDYKHSIYIYEVIVFLPVFLANCLPNLHRMSVFSAIADLLTLTCFSALLYFIFGEKPHIGGSHDMIGVLPLHIPLFTGVVLFALEAISVIIALEERMKNPRSFLGYFGIYNIGMFIVVTIYTLIGVAGYLKYGNDVLPSVHLNLPDTWVSLAFKILFIIIIYLSYPIQCYPVIAILWEKKLSLKIENKAKRVLYEYLFRFGITLFTVLLAIVIPKFDIMITLVGAICISTLGLFFPSYLEFLYYWKVKEGKYNFTMVKDILIMMIGLLILTVVVIITILNEIVSNTEIETRKESNDHLLGL